MAKNVVTLNLDNTDYSFRPYGTCSTTASTAAKVVSITGFTLCTGATVLVKFENNNTVVYPTLNINNTGAKSIIGGNLTSGGIYEFMYDGTYWNIIKSDSSKNYHVIDLTSLSQDNFYPVIFNAGHYVNDCEIHSPKVAGTSAYNQNILHFQLHARGYSDTPKSFKVLSYGTYSSSEITIGAVGYGDTSGEHCVWVRGGMKYEFICNIKPVLYTDGYSNNEQAFMPGTNYYGGENARVTICWSADNPRSEVLSEAATSTKLGGIKIGYTQSGKNYPVKLASDNKAYVNVPWTDNTDTKNTAGSTNNSSKLYLIGATEQSANPQTYSNSKVYATDGVLTATTFNGTATNADKLGGQLPDYYATASALEDYKTAVSNTYVKKAGDTMTGDLTIKTNSSGAPSIVLQRGETNDTYEDWKITDVGGYFKIQNRNSENTWADVLSAAPSATKTLTSSYSILPSVTNTLSLGNSTYKWSNVYATNFNGALIGNADTATSATKSTNIAGGSKGCIPYQSNTNTTVMLGTGDPGQVLKMNSSGLPGWADNNAGNAVISTNIAGGTKGSIPYQSAANTTTMLGIGSEGQVLKVSSDGVPVWSSDNNTDTKNTAGSTNSTSKLFLIGATSQGANPQTYSNSQVYATNGVLTATGFDGPLKGASLSDVNLGYSDKNLKFYTTISGCTATEATGNKRYAGTANSYGFPVSNNANSMLWLGGYSGNYGHQLGFSSNGNIYMRYISAGSFPETTNGGSWKALVTTSDSDANLIEATATEIQALFS